MTPNRTYTAWSELKASTWLMEQGYEVYINTSPYGPIDLIARDPKNNKTLFVDVKTISYAKWTRADGTRITKKIYSGKLNSEQTSIGVIRLGIYKTTGEIEWIREDQ